MTGFIDVPSSNANTVHPRDSQLIDDGRRLLLQ
jgi:hypothetical protein